MVTWLQVLALFLVAAILGVTAWATWRTLHVHGQRLEPHRAVNRLVLAKACALVGVLAAGGYAGYALSWVGIAAELADQRMLRSGVAALGGLLTCGRRPAARTRLPGRPHRGRVVVVLAIRSFRVSGSAAVPLGNMRHTTHI